MSDPRVPVVVITHDRRDELLQSLERLRALPERPHVVVVDNASVDGTAQAVATAFPEVQLIRADCNLGASGRNVGVETVETPYVAFDDDDTFCKPGSIREAAELFDRHPSLAVLTARIVVEPAGTEDSIFKEMAEIAAAKTRGLPGSSILSSLAGASVIRRSAYLGAGGFEPKFFIGGEEELLSVDLAPAGWELAYVPHLVVLHRASSARDPSAYRRRGIRNTLWFTWLRRPVPSALRRTLSQLRRLPADRVAAAGLIDALAGIPWVLRNRRVVPAEVESGLRLLDRPQLDSAARQ